MNSIGIIVGSFLVGGLIALLIYTKTERLRVENRTEIETVREMLFSIKEEAQSGLPCVDCSSFDTDVEILMLELEAMKENFLSLRMANRKGGLIKLLWVRRKINEIDQRTVEIAEELASLYTDEEKPLVVIKII